MGFVASILGQIVQGTVLGGGDDEKAVAEAISMMFDMCGNEGQVSIISNGQDTFEEWANDLLENPDADPDPTFLLIETIGDDAYMGSSEIWDAGTQAIYEQSQFHDSDDELGEGEGVEIGGAGLLSMFAKVVTKTLK